MDLLVIFITGLTTGGLTCLAMQGGLLTSVIANQKESEHESGKFSKNDWQPVVLFLGTKLIAYTILGFLLGLLGSVLTLSLEVRLAFQVFTALFMFATAMNLLNVHPIFRYVVLQPPKFLQRYVRKSSKSDQLFAPALLGFLTIFIPCGVTQAMEVLAINSGNPVYGALIMFSFVLGTSPLFGLIGIATAKLSERWYQSFMRVAAMILIGMALYSLNGVLVVTDSPFSYQNIVARIQAKQEQKTVTPTAIGITDGVQKVNIGVYNSGYSPNYFRVQKDVPVEISLQSNETYSCAVAFVFPSFGIKTFLDPTDIETYSFTPTKPGRYTYTCSMGMYTGIMEVI